MFNVRFGQSMQPPNVGVGPTTRQQQPSTFSPVFAGGLQQDTLSLRFGGTNPAQGDAAEPKQPFYTEPTESARALKNIFRISGHRPYNHPMYGTQPMWELTMATHLLMTPEVQEYLTSQGLQAEKMLARATKMLQNTPAAQLEPLDDERFQKIDQQIERFAEQEKTESITPVTMWRWLMKGRNTSPVESKNHEIVLATLSAESAADANKLLEAPPESNMGAKFAEWYGKHNKPIISADDKRIQEAEQILPELMDRVFGQDDGVKSIADSLYNGITGFPNKKKPHRPLARIMAMGPTGTGKTFTPEQLAEIQGRRVITVACNELQDETGLGKLVGAGPGYAGHDSKNFVDELMEANKAMMEDGEPAPIIIFDEIEKAAPKVQEILMTFLDKGVITGSDRSKVGYGSGAIVFLTSNLGQVEMNELKEQGASPEEIQQAALAALEKPWRDASGDEKRFKPEFLARIEKKLVYNHITPADAARTLESKLKHSYIDPAKEFDDCELVVTPEVEEAILDKGYSWRYGLRFLEDAVDQFFTPFNEERMRLIKEGQLKPGGKMLARVEDGQLKLDYQAPQG